MFIMQASDHREYNIDIEASNYREYTKEFYKQLDQEVETTVREILSETEGVENSSKRRLELGIEAYNKILAKIDSSYLEGRQYTNALKRTEGKMKELGMKQENFMQ